MEVMRYKVLIIDDDPIILVLHKSIAIRSGLCNEEPLSFQNGKAALEYLCANATDTESYLLLLDIHMPLMNGWEFLDSVKSTPVWEQMKVILISSSIDARDHEKAKQYSKVIRYIEKPLGVDICSKLPEIVLNDFR
jgi:CheY-like chemotaxis protein